MGQIPSVLLELINRHDRYGLKRKEHGCYRTISHLMISFCEIAQKAQILAASRFFFLRI